MSSDSSNIFMNETFPQTEQSRQPWCDNFKVVYGANYQISQTRTTSWTGGIHNESVQLREFGGSDLG